MPCYHPLPAWRGRRVNSATGRRPVAFRLQDGYVDRALELPCGRCVGCVQDRANEWALRCEHEAKTWSSNWFVTLTYDEGWLPPGGSLVLSDLQDFWKRLRHVAPGFRYFACGEYGENFLRPHYHALVFNFAPPDLSRRVRVDGRTVFESASLDKCWGRGRTDVQAFSPAAAQYVCNYVRKSFSVSGAKVDFGGRLPPFQVMSRRPGIGGGWISKYLSDVYPDGFVTRPGGVRRRAPRFYDLTCEKVSPKMFRKVKRTRAAAAAANPDATGSRLIVREAVEQSRYSFYDSVKGRAFERDT